MTPNNQMRMETLNELRKRTPNQLRKEIEELRLKKGMLAVIIGQPPSVLSAILSGVRQPSDKVLRRLNFVFHFVRSTSGFALDTKGVRFLRRGIRELERSIVLSNRPAPKDAPPLPAQPAEHA